MDTFVQRGHLWCHHGVINMSKFTYLTKSNNVTFILLDSSILKERKNTLTATTVICLWPSFLTQTLCHLHARDTVIVIPYTPLNKVHGNIKADTVTILYNSQKVYHRQYFYTPSVPRRKSWRIDFTIEVRHRWPRLASYTITYISNEYASSRGNSNCHSLRGRYGHYVSNSTTRLEQKRKNNSRSITAAIGQLVK